jgi:hypothetical protein
MVITYIYIIIYRQEAPHKRRATRQRLAVGSAQASIKLSQSSIMSHAPEIRGMFGEKGDSRNW